MKNGNEYYIGVRVVDAHKCNLNMDTVKKIIFIVNDTKYIYDDKKDTYDKKVTYDKEAEIFKIFFTEAETLALPSYFYFESDILFKNNLVSRSKINTIFTRDTINKEVIK